MTQTTDNQKEGKWFLREAEDKFRNKVIPHIPSFIETYHLTYMTLLWSGLIVLFGWLARGNIKWLWLVSLMIFFQYLTDLFDGALGRYRNTGLVKWGYYMDHFLDFLFLSSIILAYALLFPPGLAIVFFILLTLSCSFLVSVYLSFVSSNKLNISFLRMGPTEGRIALILLNTLLIIFGVPLAQKALPYIAGAETIILFLMVYKTQKKLWKEDMAAKDGQRIAP
ncbi:hypothetical protein C4572_00485 [Candidatus Parcubacteria bacterium]|nr:MAG: hypothetical protein C4572_00485 [Candidatus Parcubacteria bacterium]